MEAEVDEEASMSLRTAFDKLSQEADNGSGEAMYLLAMYYQTGFPPVAIDQSVRFHWLKRSFDAGYAPAGPELNAMLKNPESVCYDLNESRRVSERLAACLQTNLIQSNAATN